MDVSFGMLVALLSAAGLAGCAQRPAWDPRSLGDIVPPVFERTLVDGSGTLELRFDEPVSLVVETLLVEPPLAPPEVHAAGTSLFVAAAGQQRGAEYSLELTVEDTSGNTAALVTRFTGFNPEVPRLLINELTPRGSGDHPDLVELRALTGGDLAGVTLYQGTPSDWTDRLVFPSCRVAAGDFVLVHFRPDGGADERDETASKTESGGRGACATAWDFWVRGGQGLGGNNGVVSLYDRPGGSLLDGILYSNRTSESDSVYGGFGSAATLARARELVGDGGWIAATGSVRPEDAVSPEGSTATRSIARGSASADTNSREDWHVTPTRGATWGAINTDLRYEAPAARRDSTGDP